jgi:Flp pilus assembly protein TadG
VGIESSGTNAVPSNSHVDEGRPMSGLDDPARGRRGQVFPLVAIMMTGLIGMVAFVLDVGAWDRTHRSMQATADASALAAAQDLPYDQIGASALATTYVGKNGGGTATVTFPAANQVKVSMMTHAPGTFAKVYGPQNASVTIRAEATATAGLVSQAQGAVPLVVSKNQPQLTACNGIPCFNTSTTLKINDDTSLGGGQAGLIDLRTTGDGSVTAQQIADWVTSGLSSNMPPNQYYYSAGSCKFSNQSFHQALDAKVASASPLLFPVYDPARTDVGSNPPRYFIIGWAAFVITSYRLNGCGNKSDFITGYYVHDVVHGTSDGSATGDFGVRVVMLTG